MIHLYLFDTSDITEIRFFINHHAFTYYINSDGKFQDGWRFGGTARL